MKAKPAVWPALALASVTALTLAGCESSGHHRIASVGSGGTGGIGDSGGGGGDGVPGGGGGTGTGGGMDGGGTGGTGTTGGNGLIGNLIVTAGNTVIGVAGKHDGLAQVVNGVVPKAGIVTGTVTAVLEKTGQTLVRLGEGAGGGSGGPGGLILDGVGGKVGALVALDLGQGKVIAAPAGSKPLIGLNVLAQNPTTGTLATVGAASGGSLVAVDVAPSGNGVVGGVLGGVTGTAGKVVGSTVGKVTGTSSGDGGKGLLGTTVGKVTGATSGNNGGLLGLGKPKGD